MPLFELADFEKVELASCDPDIAEAFKKIGGGYYHKYPSLIQLNRHLERLNKNLEILIKKSNSAENSSNNCKKS